MGVVYSSLKCLARIQLKLLSVKGTRQTSKMLGGWYASMTTEPRSIERRVAEGVPKAEAVDAA